MNTNELVYILQYLIYCD